MSLTPIEVVTHNAATYTTPLYRCRVKGADLTGMDLLLTMRQGKNVIELTNEDFGCIDIDSQRMEALIAFNLTQEQSAGFVEGWPVKVQLNAIDPQGVRAATNIAYTTFFEQLHKEVMPSA